MLTAQQIAILREELARPEYAGLDDFQKWHRLHVERTVANPDPPPLVPAPIDPTAVMLAISAESLARCVAHAGPYLDMAAHFVSGNRSALNRDAALFARLGAITVSEYQAIVALLAETVPDPDWPATVPAPSRLQTVLPGLLLTLPTGERVTYVPFETLVSEVLHG